MINTLNISRRCSISLAVLSVVADNHHLCMRAFFAQNTALEATRNVTANRELKVVDRHEIR